MKSIAYPHFSSVLHCQTTVIVVIYSNCVRYSSDLLCYKVSLFNVKPSRIVHWCVVDTLVSTTPIGAYRAAIQADMMYIICII